jgi:hypothetical protein
MQQAAPDPLVTFQELQEFDEKEARKFKLSRGDPGLVALGLMIGDKLDEFRYDWCTPSNCLTFATTGGNGIHFSFLVENGTISPRSPIVVTNPGYGGISWIVGKNLYDFLCLGYHRGYFALEQLAYQRELTLEVYTNAQWKPTKPDDHSVGYVLSEEQRLVLNALIKRFGLRPWNSPETFHRLQDKYMGLLKEPKSEE